MRTPIILLDMDGVLADTHASLRAYVADAVGPGHAFPDEILDWHISTPHPATNRAIQDGFRKPGFFRDFEVYPGAQEAVAALRERAEVFFCSTPYRTNPTCSADKAAWLVEHFGRGSDKRLVLTADKTIVHGDVLVDDKPDIEGAWAPAWQQVLVDHPYNRDVRLPRIHGWDESGVDRILEIAARRAAR